MAKRLDSDLRKWALIGAERRLVELAEEAAAIHRAFPELRQRGPKTARGAEPGAEGSGGRRRKRRKMSAAARKRISMAQKARWAKQKAQR